MDFSNQNVLATASSPKETQQNFQMILGSLAGQLEGEGNTQFTQKGLNPLEEIAELLRVDLLDLEWTKESTENRDLENLVGELFPEWEKTILELLDSLRRQDTEKHAEEKLPADFLSAILQVVQLINDLDPKELRELPAKELKQSIQMAKELQVMARQIPISLSEMSKLNELEQDFQSLLDQIQKANKESKLKQMASIVDKTFYSFKKEQTDPPGVSDLSNTGLESKNVMTSTNQLRSEGLILNLGKSVDPETEMRGFVRELANILARSNYSQTGNTTKLLIRLYPEELGSLRIELLQKDGLMTAKFLASTTTAKEMLDLQLNNLRHAFQQQNLTVDRIEVSYSTNTQSQYTAQQEHNPHDRQGEQSSKEQQTENIEEATHFQEMLSELLFEAEV